MALYRSLSHAPKYIALPKAMSSTCENTAVLVRNMPASAPESLLKHILADSNGKRSIVQRQPLRARWTHSWCPGSLVRIERHSDATVTIVFDSSTEAQQAACRLQGNTLFGTPALSVSIDHPPPGISTLPTVTSASDAVAPSPPLVPLLGPMLRPTKAQAAQPGLHAKKNLYVVNLPIDMDDYELEMTFARFGTVRHVCILSTADSIGRRRGFVDMLSGAAARSAALNLDGQRLRGYTLEITFAHIQRSSSVPGGFSPLFTPAKVPSAVNETLAPGLPFSYFADLQLTPRPESATTCPPVETPRQQPPPPPYDHQLQHQEGAAKDVPSRTLCVDHVTRTAAIDTREFCKIFQPYGAVDDAQLVCRTSAPDDSWGQVAFASAEDAERARLDLDGRMIGGAAITVTRLDNRWLVRKSTARVDNFPRPSAPSSRVETDTSTATGDRVDHHRKTAPSPLAPAFMSKSAMPLPAPSGDGIWPSMSFNRIPMSATSIVTEITPWSVESKTRKAGHHSRPSSSDSLPPTPLFVPNSSNYDEESSSSNSGRSSALSFP